MVTIPLYVFLFVYFAFLIIFCAFLIMIFYHIVITASFTLTSFIISFFIFTLTVLTLYFTWQFLSTMDWRSTFVIFDSAWLGGVFGY